MAELTYRKVGDYYIPDLILDEEPEQDVFYGSTVIFGATTSGSISPNCGWCW